MSSNELEKNFQKNIFKFSRINRFSNIFFNMSLTLFAIIVFLWIVSFATPIVWVLVLAVVFTIIIGMVFFTVGTVFAFPNNPIPELWLFLKDFSSSASLMVNITNIISKITICIAIIGIIISATLLIFAILSKDRYKLFKITSAIISILIFIFIVSMGGINV